MSIARLSLGDINQDLKRARVELPLVIDFSDEDKIGTIQLHNDASVITLRIGGLDLLASWGVDTLFLPFMSSLKLWPDFGVISSALLSEKSST